MKTGTAILVGLTSFILFSADGFAFGGLARILGHASAPPESPVDGESPAKESEAPRGIDLSTPQGQLEALLQPNSGFSQGEVNDLIQSQIAQIPGLQAKLDEGETDISGIATLLGGDNQANRDLAEQLVQQNRAARLQAQAKQSPPGVSKTMGDVPKNTPKNEFVPPGSGKGAPTLDDVMSKLGKQQEQIEELTKLLTAKTQPNTGKNIAEPLIGKMPESLHAPQGMQPAPLVPPTGKAPSTTTPTTPPTVTLPFTPNGNGTIQVGPSQAINFTDETWSQTQDGRWRLVDTTLPQAQQNPLGGTLSRWYNLGQDANGRTQWVYVPGPSGTPNLTQQSIFFDRPNNMQYMSFGMANNLGVFNGPRIPTIAGPTLPVGPFVSPPSTPSPSGPSVQSPSVSAPNFQPVGTSPVTPSPSGPGSTGPSGSGVQTRCGPNRVRIGRFCVPASS